MQKSRNPADSRRKDTQSTPPRRFCNGLDLGAFQGKSNLGLDAQMALKARPLVSRAVLGSWPHGFLKPQKKARRPGSGLVDPSVQVVVRRAASLCPLAALLGARTRASLASSSCELGGRCAEGCQEALGGREDCPQGMQVCGCAPFSVISWAKGRLSGHYLIWPIMSNRTVYTAAHPVLVVAALADSVLTSRTA